MITTGVTEIDSLYRKSKTISSSHKIIAEWNNNAYTEIDYLGSYPIDIRADGNDEAASKTFDSSVNATWDNGGHYYLVKSSSGNYAVEDKLRKKLTNIKEIISPERPDPGIIFAMPVPSSSPREIISNCTNSRAYNLLQADTRFYPLNENQGSKYWFSARNYNPEVTSATEIELIGVSDINGRMKGNNVFLHYANSVRANKIVVKTQINNGYARDFTVEVLPSGSSTWVVAYQTTNSTTMNDGILRLSRKYVSGSWQWVVAAGVEEEGTIDSLLKSSTTGYQSIVGIRFSVQELADVATNNPKDGGTLDVIELSSRMVVDMTSYTETFSTDSNIGDSALGLPIGSIVAGTGSIEFFNDDNLISDKNVLSIFEGILKPNVKFTILHKVTLDTTTKYVPVNVMYSNSWDEQSDWKVTVSLEDYMKFLRDKPAPDILLGALDGIRVSSIIKILLDNAGFTRFSFSKTADTSEYLQEDVRVDFFYSKKESTVAEVLNELAKTTQLSMFFDQYGYLNAYTKEAVTQKTPTYNYMLVGDHKSAVDGIDLEYDVIYDNTNNEYSYISNIESFEDSDIAPITSGEVAYSTLGIPKASLALIDQYLIDNPFSSLSTETKKIIDSGFSEVSLNRDIGYVPQKVWSPNTNSDTNEAYLAAGVLIKDIGSSRPKDILLSQTFEAKNNNDAVRAAYESMTETQRKSSQIVISENDLTVSFRTAFSGTMYIDTEMIKYDGILYNITKPGYVAERKIYFSKAELESDIAEAPTKSNFVPYALIVSMSMEAQSFPDAFAGTDYIFYCKDDGRGYNSTEISSHSSKILDENWSRFASKLYSPASGQSADLGQSLKAVFDTGVPDITNVTKTTLASAGFAQLSGLPKSLTDTVPDTVSSEEINISNVGQQHIVGYRKSAGFNPKRIGTRMNLYAEEGGSSAIAGFGFNLTNSAATTGYFVEVSSVSSNYNPSSISEDNVKFYKVYNDSGTIKPKLLGSAWFRNAIATQNTRSITLAEAGMVEGSLKSVFTVEVEISSDNKSYIVFINGQAAISVYDSDPLDPTNEIGLFVRDDSDAIYDYIYAIPTRNYPAVDYTGKNEIYETAIESSKSRGIFSPFIQSIIGESTPISYDDFGNVAREAKFIEVRFNEPAFASKLIELSRINPDYFVKDFKSSSWGASFWVYNSGRSVSWIGGESPFPLFISGIVLRRTSSGTVDIGKYLKTTNPDTINDNLQINRRLYGEQSINVSAEYLNNYEEAERLANWIAQYASKEKKEIKATIFPNPLLQLGDKIKVFYKARGYTHANLGDKTYLLSQIGYSTDSTGIQMNVTLREML